MLPLTQVAAKLGSKRPLEDGPEPSSKKVASIESYPPQPPQNMRFVLITTNTLIISIMILKKTVFMK